MSTTATSRRHPWLAVLLAVLCPGLGHVYCGRVTAGLVFFFAAWLIPPIAVMMAARLSPSPTGMGVLIGSVLLELVIYLLSILDAWRAAGMSGASRPCAWSRPGVYVTLFVAGVVGPAATTFAVRAELFEAYVVPMSGMHPTILNGDRVLAAKSVYDVDGPERGDVIVFRCPGDRAQTFVKRVVAIAGDTVAIEAGRVIVNGLELQREPVPDADSACVWYEANRGRRYRLCLDGPASDESLDELTVPPATCFVLGDHRGNSVDSRGFGPVPTGDVIGRVDYVYYPAGSWSRFGRLEPAP